MKSESSTAAGQYAQALIELATQAAGDTAETILNDLRLINQVIQDNPDLSITLKHPSISGLEKKRLLLTLFEGKIHELCFRLINLLADKLRLELLQHIEREYGTLLRRLKNIIVASLVSAEPLSNSQVDAIKHKLTSKLGSQLELDIDVDPSLIGGVILRVGDQVIDGSLRGKLTILEKSLLSV